MPNRTANQTPTRRRSQAAPPHVSRRARKSLQPEVAVNTALELARPEGAGGLTMRRLGEELDVDPAMLYRLFRDKDELLVAVYDRAPILGSQR